MTTPEHETPPADESPDGKAVTGSLEAATENPEAAEGYDPLAPLTAVTESDDNG